MVEQRDYKLTAERTMIKHSMNHKTAIMNVPNLTTVQRFALAILRIFIGWHFLYEGVIKAYNPAWTAKGYLLSASILKPFFTWLASDSLISVIDNLNIAALIIVGVSLIAGIKVRWGCLVGIALLLLYYLAHPPFPGLPQGPSEGSYWIVNKNLVEMAALFVVYLFPLANASGQEVLFSKRNVKTAIN